MLQSPASGIVHQALCHSCRAMHQLQPSMQEPMSFAGMRVQTLQPPCSMHGRAERACLQGGIHHAPVQQQVLQLHVVDEIGLAQGRILLGLHPWSQLTAWSMPPCMQGVRPCPAA